MKRKKLKEKIQLHNMLKIGLAIAFAGLSLLMFNLSFHIAKWISGFILEVFLDSVAGIAWWCGLFFVIILIAEGVRSGRKMVEEGSFDAYENYDFLFTRSTLGAFALRHRGWLCFAQAVTEILFIAPYAMIRALEECRRIVKADDQLVGQATDTYNYLKSRTGWTSLSEVRQFGAGVIVLFQMNLVWIDNEGIDTECRIADN